MEPCENPQSSTIRVRFTFSRRHILPRGSVGVWMLRQHTCANMAGPAQGWRGGHFQGDERALHQRPTSGRKGGARGGKQLEL